MEKEKTINDETAEILPGNELNDDADISDGETEKDCEQTNIEVPKNEQQDKELEPLSDDVIIAPNFAENEEYKPNIKKHVTIKNIIITASLAVVLAVICIFSFFYIRDMNAAKDVITKIGSIGEVTLDSKDTISSAKTAYDNLSDSQKKKVKNYDVLSVAISTYNTKKDEYDKLQYKTYLTVAGAGCDLIENFCSAVFSDVSTVWFNAIHRRTDEYNNGNFDFETAITNWYIKSKEQYSDLFDTAEKNKSYLDTTISNLKNPPSEYEKEYDILLNLYATTSNMYDLALNPTGSYNTYTSKTQSLISEFDTNKAIFDGLTQ